MANLDSSLPSNYDAIVVGTGMTECIIAAALARNGLNVLHLDRNDYYSGDWASFNFKSLKEWKEKQQNPELSKLCIKDYSADLVTEGACVIQLNVNTSAVRNVVEKTYIPGELQKDDSISNDVSVAPHGNNETQNGHKNSEIEVTTDESNPNLNNSSATDLNQDSDEAIKCAEDKRSDEQSHEFLEPHGEKSTDIQPETDKTSSVTQVCQTEVKAEKRQWCYKDLNDLWRKFNIDLMPKVLYCRGPMVDLLISSDVAKYCEFKTVNKVLTFINDKIEQVPCSRSDVFASKQVSMIEKRMMMKFLTFCMDYHSHTAEYQGYEDKSFREFLMSKKLSSNVQHYIQHAIAMVTDHATTIQGLESAQLFLHSLGRYGNTAFLWPMYGSGELPQCFCRMCAVFGGIYCLKRTVQCVITDTQRKVTSVVDTEGQCLSTKWLIVEASYATDDMLYSETDRPQHTARAILITDRSLQPAVATDTDHISLLSYQTADAGVISILELPASSQACPQGLFIVHLTAKAVQGPELDFKPIMDKLFAFPTSEPINERPQVLWSLMFEMADTTSVKPQNLPDNMFIVGGPNYELDFNYAIKKAKEIFATICPNDEFLPKAPNPEDIIWDDGHGNQPPETGFKEDTEIKPEQEN